jgi:hypothetical protein
MFYVYGIFSTNGMKVKEIEAYYTGTFTCIFDRHAKTSATDARRYVGWGATFSKVPAQYPDPARKCWPLHECVQDYDYTE